jgi:hypothetical protein
MNRFFKGYGECIRAIEFLFGEYEKNTQPLRGELEEQKQVLV